MLSDFIPFVKKDIFLNPEYDETPYRRRNDEEKKCIHWGQRKLLLTVIQFLTLFWDPTQVPNPVVVYAGAAPGNNIGVISQLFPEVEFHLYDPRPFKIKPIEGKIYLYNQYFTNKDAEKWSDRSDIYFISDIRTADYTKTKDLNQNESQILTENIDYLDI